MFVYSSAYYHALDELATDPAALPAALRAQALMKAVEHVGRSVLLSSTTDFLAFLCGSFTPYPVLRYFSITGALCILMDWIMEHLIFLPMVVIWDVNRPPLSTLSTPSIHTVSDSGTDTTTGTRLKSKQ